MTIGEEAVIAVENARRALLPVLELAKRDRMASVEALADSTAIINAQRALDSIEKWWRLNYSEKPRCSST